MQRLAKNGPTKKHCVQSEMQRLGSIHRVFFQPEQSGFVTWVASHCAIYRLELGTGSCISIGWHSLTAIPKAMLLPLKHMDLYSARFLHYA